MTFINCRTASHGLRDMVETDSTANMSKISIFKGYQCKSNNKYSASSSIS